MSEGRKEGRGGGNKEDEAAPIEGEGAGAAALFPSGMKQEEGKRGGGPKTKRRRSRLQLGSQHGGGCPCGGKAGGRGLAGALRVAKAKEGPASDEGAKTRRKTRKKWTKGTARERRRASAPAGALAAGKSDGTRKKASAPRAGPWPPLPLPPPLRPSRSQGRPRPSTRRAGPLRRRSGKKGRRGGGERRERDEVRGLAYRAPAQGSG